MSNLSKQSQGFVGALTMSSREIAELTGKRHANVIRDIRSMLGSLEQNSNLSSAYKSTNYTGSNGQSYPQYELDKDLTLTLMLGYDTAARFKVVQRWQELEQKEAAPVVNPAQLSRMQLIQLAMEAEEEKLALEAKVQEQAPKVEALERISADLDSLTVTETSKILGVKRKHLTEWLAANKWVYRQNGSWVAYDAQIRRGHLVYKEAKYTDDSTGLEARKPYCHVTPKGLVALAKSLNKEAPPYGNIPVPSINAYLEARG